MYFVDSRAMSRPGPSTSRAFLPRGTRSAARRYLPSFPSSSIHPPSPFLPLLHPRRFSSQTLSAQTTKRFSTSPATHDFPPGSRPEESTRAAPPHLAQVALDGSAGQEGGALQNAGLVVTTSRGRQIQALVKEGRATEAEASLKAHILTPLTNVAVDATPEEIKHLAAEVLELVLHPPRTSSGPTLERDDVENSTHHGSTLTRHAIRFLHFLRVHGQPRTERMYGLLIRKILDQGHVDLAARVYVELVEEWAWHQRRAAAKEKGGEDLEVPWEWEGVEESVSWLKKVDWVEPASQDVAEWEAYKRTSGNVSFEGSHREQTQFEEFRARRREERARVERERSKTAAEIEVEQHLADLEQDQPFQGFFKGFRWNHRAETQRRTLCWAPSPSRLRLYLSRFPPSVPKSPMLKSSTIPFPSMTLLNPILESTDLTSLAPWSTFSASARALAIIANTVLCRTLPLSHVTVLIKTFETLPQYPRVYAPLPSPDPVDDTTAYAHVQGALSSLVYGLPPGSMNVNVEKYGLNFISESSANSLLSYTLTTLHSPRQGEKVLSYMRCQGYLASPASTRKTGAILVNAGLTSRIWRHFVEGLQMTVGDMAGSVMKFFHEPPRSLKAWDSARGSYWHRLTPPDNGDLPAIDVSGYSVTPIKPTPVVTPRDVALERLSDASPNNDDASGLPAHIEVRLPNASELGPEFKDLLSRLRSTTPGVEVPGTVANFLQYAIAAQRWDLIFEMYESLLLRDNRPVKMTGDIYRQLVRGLIYSGAFRRAEQVFSLARREQMTLGVELDFDIYLRMVRMYASLRRRGLGHFTETGEWVKAGSTGTVFPGEEERSVRALKKGWALYRGIVWGQWEHWQPFQDQILYEQSPYPRRAWFSRPVDPSSNVPSPKTDPEDFEAKVAPNLEELFNAAIRLLVNREGMQTIPRRLLRNTDILSLSIETVSKQAANKPRATWPQLKGEDLYLSLVAMDIKRAGFNVPRAVQLLLAHFPTHQERMAQVESSRPITTLNSEKAFHPHDPYRLWDRNCSKAKLFRVFDEGEMNKLARMSTYPEGTFDGSEIGPSDWPLLVQAHLEGRSEDEFTLPPGLWQAALEFTYNFALSDDGRSLLLVGLTGQPLPFIPTSQRLEWINTNWANRGEQLGGESRGAGDVKIPNALRKLAWWPEMNSDLNRKKSEFWRQLKDTEAYLQDVEGRISSVRSAGARRDVSEEEGLDSFYLPHDDEHLSASSTSSSAGTSFPLGSLPSAPASPRPIPSPLPAPPSSGSTSKAPSVRPRTSTLSAPPPSI